MSFKTYYSFYIHEAQKEKFYRMHIVVIVNEKVFENKAKIK